MDIARHGVVPLIYPTKTWAEITKQAVVPKHRAFENSHPTKTPGEITKQGLAPKHRAFGDFLLYHF